MQGTQGSAGSANGSPGESYVKRMTCLQMAKDQGAMTSPEHAYWKSIATSQMMGLDPQAATPGSNNSNSTKSRKRLQPEASDHSSDEDQPGSRHSSKLSGKSGDAEVASKNARAARGSMVVDLLATSATSVTLICVVLQSGEVQQRKIQNTFKGRDGETVVVWGPSTEEDGWYCCTVCGKTGVGSGGGWMNACKVGFSSQVFKTKMNHNKYRTHVNKVIRKLPTELEDGAKPILWPKQCQSAGSYMKFCEETTAEGHNHPICMIDILPWAPRF